MAVNTPHPALKYAHLSVSGAPQAGRHAEKPVVKTEAPPPSACVAGARAARSLRPNAGVKVQPAPESERGDPLLQLARVFLVSAGQETLPQQARPGR